MIRLAARRLWTRRLQALAPLVALLAATLGFQAVLVSARSTQSHVQGVIAANWNPPYDLLVRPPSLVTGLKPGDHLIRPNYLDSAPGGISLAQVASVRAAAGVSVAAPVGVVAVDYLWGQGFAIDVSKLPKNGDLTAFRVKTDITTDGGLSTVASQDDWSYVLVQGSQPPYVWATDANSNLVVGGRLVQCYYLDCYAAPSRIPQTTPETFPYTPTWSGDRHPYYTTLTAAIVAVDPEAEAALSSLSNCVVSGRNLTAADAVVSPKKPLFSDPSHILILLNSRPGFDDRIHATIQMATSIDPLLKAIATLPVLPRSRYPEVNPSNVQPLPFRPVGEVVTDVNQAWNGAGGAGIGFTHGSIFSSTAAMAVDSIGPVNYVGKVPNLTAQTVGVDQSNGYVPFQPFNLSAPPEQDPTNFRVVRALVPRAAPDHSIDPDHTFTQVGSYDAACVTKGSPVASSAFDIYANPDTTAPNGTRLGPNASITNYVTPMPAIMTNLNGGQWFSDPARFSGGKGNDFLSVVRVKVSGTSVPGPVSQKRLEQVAADIHKRTGLAVDIIKGSSTRTMSIKLPAGGYGRPPMTVHEDWLVENVAITFYNSINATTLVMSTVVTVVAVLLTMQTTYAAVRRRRGELVLLRAIGWPSWRLALLMELEVVSLGVLVALIALLAAALMILVNHPGGGVEAGILLAAPAAVGLTAFAGLGPAFTASRTRPLAALRGPGRLRKRRRRLIRGPFTLGIREALTTWRWQTLIGAIATAVGAMFLGAVLAIVHDFHTSLDSTALAQQLANEVGPFDILLGVLAVVLGATTAVSVVLVATRERLPHFATLRALGWSRAKVARVVAGQALAVGLLGGVLGVIALSVVANRVKTGIALTLSSQLSPLLLGAATGIAAAIGAVRLVYRRVIVTVLRVG